MKNEKTLKGFLESLQDLTKANIEFLDGKDPNFTVNKKYIVELRMVSVLINSWKLD